MGSDYERELSELDWGSYFIKDYVKSLTTSAGSIIDDPAKIKEMVQDFTDFRGEVEGGLCVRRVEPFLPDTEQRYFVLSGKSYSFDGVPAPDIVQQVAERIKLPFYSVDVIEREDGTLRVVEIGDGQVSDLKSWPAKAFVDMWRQVD